MLNEMLKKVVVIGWNNFTISLVEGLHKAYPNIQILSLDITDEEYKIGVQSGYLNPLPKQKNLIFEDADFILIDQVGQQLLYSIQKIKPYLHEKTYVMDFQAIKTPLYDEIQKIIGNTYISSYVFLDEYPEGMTIRSSIFRDKIVALISNGTIGTLKDCRTFWNSVNVKLVPTSAEFFDEIYAMTTQSIEIFAMMYATILQKDSWADTLFFGFYNKLLRNFLSPVKQQYESSTDKIIKNAENIRRILNFIKREITYLDQLIDDENVDGLNRYLSKAKEFDNRI